MRYINVYINRTGGSRQPVPSSATWLMAYVADGVVNGCLCLKPAEDCVRGARKTYGWRMQLWDALLPLAPSHGDCLASRHD